jgi:hypothetical protein
MAETPIVSETLQQEFRTTFPSQVSSGRDLHVSDTIIPIVDFSTQASVSTLPENLAQAYSFTNANAFSVNNTTTTVINVAGYWKLSLNMSDINNTTGQPVGSIILSDGSTDKTLVDVRRYGSGGTAVAVNQVFEYILFLKAGESVKITTIGTYAFAVGVARQLADSSGTVINPS